MGPVVALFQLILSEKSGELLHQEAKRSYSVRSKSLPHRVLSRRGTPTSPPEVRTSGGSTGPREKPQRTNRLIYQRAPPTPRFAVVMSINLLLVSLASTRTTATGFVISPVVPSTSPSSPWSTAATVATTLAGGEIGVSAAAATVHYTRPACGRNYCTRSDESFAVAAPVSMSATTMHGGGGVTLTDAPVEDGCRGSSTSVAATAGATASATAASVVSPSLEHPSELAPLVRRLSATTTDILTVDGSSTTDITGPETVGQAVILPPLALTAAAAAASSVAITTATTCTEDAKRKKPVGRVKVLPGTWWMAGLPKWVHVVRRRMLTKQDWLHVHAASGLVYQVGGGIWLMNVMCLELFGEVPQLDVNTPATLFLLGAGLVSSLSSLPMANTRSWVLNGVCSSVLQLWFAWYVSGAYPACLDPADPWLAAAGLTILLISYVEAEQAIAEDDKSRVITRQAPALRYKKASGKIMMRKEDYVQGNAVNRYGALANLLLNAPHLFATLVGSGWVERLSEGYPAAPALLFHAYFALATSTSISLLAPTLYTRRLINAKTFAAMQFISLAPMVTSAIDATVMGAAATNNPLELYLGFLH